MLLVIAYIAFVVFMIISLPLWAWVFVAAGALYYSMDD